MRQMPRRDRSCFCGPRTVSFEGLWACEKRWVNSDSGIEAFKLIVVVEIYVVRQLGI